jgi:Flp pilus assembly protein TadG
MSKFKPNLPKFNQRRNRGAMVTLLITAVSILILLTLGVFAFEATRAYTARDELRSATEAASLAAAAALASSDSLDPVASHLNSINAAHATFNNNTVVGNRLATAATVFTDTHMPSPGMSSLRIQFLDPNNNNLPTAAPAYDHGTNVRIVAAYTLQPAFNLGIGTHTIRAESNGKTPTLDLVMCFDISSSMDDQTKLTVVRRIWNGTRVVYEVVDAPGSSYQAGNVSPRAAGKMFDIFNCAPQGGGLNAAPPQRLANANFQPAPLQFNAVGRQLRNGGAAADAGSPPGNYPGGAVTWTPDVFTDMVVNIDDRNDFVSATYNGYSFPDLATLVEAARGNLENNGVFTSSQANTGVPASVSPRNGYQAAYFAAAYANTEPCNTAKQAALRFFQIMKNNTDAHFGLVCFATGAYTNPAGTYTQSIVDPSYPPATSSSYPIPGVQLSATNNNFSQIHGTIVPRLMAGATPEGSTNIGDAVQAATNMLNSPASRQNAKRAILVFTDGQWTTGMDPATAALNAKNANKDIAIYSIGLALHPSLIPREVDTLNDGGAGTTYNYVDPRNGTPGSYTATTDGISKICGHDGKFFLVTNSQNLNYCFENIARNLVQLSSQSF